MKLYDLLQWIKKGFFAIQVKRCEKKLHLLESLALGEKRFVAVIQVEQQKFLIGGAVNSVTLLASLQTPATGPAARAPFGLRSSRMQGTSAWK